MKIGLLVIHRSAVDAQLLPIHQDQIEIYTNSSTFNLLLESLDPAFNIPSYYATRAGLEGYCIIGLYGFGLSIRENTIKYVKAVFSSLTYPLSGIHTVVPYSSTVANLEDFMTKFNIFCFKDCLDGQYLSPGLQCIPCPSPCLTCNNVP